MKYGLFISLFLCLFMTPAYSLPPDVETLLSAQKAKGALHMLQCARSPDGGAMFVTKCTFYDGYATTGALIQHRNIPTGYCDDSSTAVCLSDIWELTFAKPGFSEDSNEDDLREGQADVNAEQRCFEERRRVALEQIEVERRRLDAAQRNYSRAEFDNCDDDSD